jgi:hypothetical protein
VPLLKHGKSDLGRSLLGPLLSVAILGVAAAIAVSTTGSGGGHGTGLRGPTATFPASPGAAAPDVAAAATCRANYQAVETAAAQYQALHGTQPISMAALQSMFKDPVVSTRFAITIDSHHPGQIDVAANGHASLPGNGNCAYAG